MGPHDETSGHVLVNELQIELGSEKEFVERIDALTAQIAAGDTSPETAAMLEGAILQRPPSRKRSKGSWIYATIRSRVGSPFDKLKSLRDQLPVGAPVPEIAATAGAPSVGPTLGPRLVVRRERKGRGGKTVTVIEGIALRGPQLDAQLRALKKSLGCGATIEGTNLVVLGDLMDRVIDWLRASGANNIVRGT